MEKSNQQNVIPNKKYLGGALPFAFTETGVAMLSSVLKSSIAVEMNIAIIRAFVGLRKLGVNYLEVKQLLEEMRTKYDQQFDEIYALLAHLVNPPKPARQLIGFRRNDELDQ